VSSSAEHLGELLSAQLDGELTADEAAEVEAHLASCADCRTELEATAAVRTALRAAPAIDPPFGFYERMVRSRRWQPNAARTWRAGVAVLGIAAAWVVAISLIADPRATREAPPVDAVRSTLASPARPSATDDSGAIALPAQINGLRRGPAFKTKGGGTLVVFGDSPRSWIGVQTSPHKVDWSKLTGGLRGHVDGIPGNPWRSIDPGTMPAIVYESNGVEVMVAGPLDVAELQAIARQLPAPADPSLADRLAEGLRALLDGW
jgi:hypothetical protein